MPETKTKLPDNWKKNTLEKVIIKMANGITKRQNKIQDGIAVGR